MPNQNTNKKARILIVDDDEDILIAGRLLLKRQFETVVTANRPDHIPKLMAESKFDAVLLDMNFGPGETTGNEGIDWLQRILEIDPNAIVILITAHSAVEVAVEAMKLGATDFVEKPWANERLIATITNAIRFRRSEDEAKSLKKQNRELAAQTNRGGQKILGESQAIKTVLQMVERAAPTEANVLILGENGTGKELIAREIHQKSHRANQVFMSVDLGAVSESLFESELFGHKRGAFTDAKEDRIGRFEAADGGTLFLDEIGNIPLHLQAKLLTVLEQRQVIPVGTNKIVPINVRVICATNMDNLNLRDEKHFRQDLLYRLNTVEVRLPALRERREDIPMLIEAFVGQYTRKYGRVIDHVSPKAIEDLTASSWPGNIRALRHAVERAVILGQGDVLETQDFMLAQSEEEMSDITTTDGQTLEEIERSAIEKALKAHLGNISHAAKDLGITRTSLYRRMEKYGL